MKLVSLISQLVDNRMLAIEPGGNFGDYLIYAGFQRIAQSIPAQFDQLSFEDAANLGGPGKYEAIYVHGCGGYVPWWSGRACQSIEVAARLTTGTIVVGPSTVHSDVDYVRSVFQGVRKYLQGSTRLCMYAREQKSFQVLQETIGDWAEVYLDHDTAISCQPEDILSLRETSSTNGSPRGYTLFAIRQDAEQDNRTLVGKNAFAVDPVSLCNSMSEWVALHANARRIVTNRLHSSICGAVLGIPTTLLPNSYHKNRSVWEMSLRDMSVEWGPESIIAKESVWGGALQLAKHLRQSKAWTRKVNQLRFGWL